MELVKNQKKLKISLLFLVTLFTSCSTNQIFFQNKIRKNNQVYLYKHEEVSQKIKDKNYTANFVLPKNFNLNNNFSSESTFDFSSENTRAVASNKLNKAKNLTNKELYFYNLWKQYGYLNRKLKNNRDVNICPQFHNIINEKELSYNYFYQSSSIENSLEFYNQVKLGLDDSKLLPGYPVLSLDYKNEKMLYIYLKEKINKFSDLELNQIVKESLDSHYLKIEEEVSILCDKGYSPNYYLYENLVQIIKNKNLNHEELVKAYLKIPIFANMYLIENIKGEALGITNLQVFSNLTFNTFNEFEKEAIKRVNGNIFIDFLYQTSILRHNSSNISLNNKK